MAASAPAIGAPRATGGRNVLLDAGRLLFAFGVAAIHLAPNTPAAEQLTLSFLLFAVPFFLMAGMYFFVGKVAGGEGVPAARELHFERLWLPYLAWTLIYVVLHAGKDLAVHRPLEFNVLAVALYGGAAVQMYFLPLLLLLQCWAWSIALWWRVPNRRVTAGLLFAASTAFAFGGRAEGALGFEHVFTSGALYLAGAFLLWRWRHSETFRSVNATVAVLLVLGLLVLVLRGDPDDLLRIGRGPVAGYAAASLALAWPIRWTLPRWAAYLLSCSYGIYLAHFAFIEAFEFLAVRRGWRIKPYDVPEKLQVAAGVCVACVVLIALVRTWRLPRLVLLGEPVAPGKPAARIQRCSS
jgi:surface polysaccharide O-acyltransferase-like enzyme